MIELVGVVVSAGVWALGVLATRRVTGSAIAGAPESWRERFAAEYEETLSSPLHQFVLSRTTAYAAAFWLILFALLDWGDVRLGVQLGAAAVYAAFEVASERRRQREEVARWVASGMEPLERDPSLAWSYAGSLFAVLFGFAATMCFAARALIEVIGA
jgi:hypothetical protein